MYCWQTKPTTLGILSGWPVIPRTRAGMRGFDIASCGDRRKVYSRANAAQTRANAARRRSLDNYGERG